MKPPPSFDEVKSQIIHSVVQQKSQQTATELRGKAKIEYVDSEIKLQADQEAAAAAAKQKIFEQQMDEQIQKQKAIEELEGKK